ncbi:MAG: type II toxin-antitoxin system RelE/ParE family toxin [Duncaniella sp.]|nr:type II toxin-antitoxin system RelE/ParE family toxin [Duncaniella sp.]
MVVIFDKEYLKDLYTEGRCNDNKHRYAVDVVRRYKRAVDYLKMASRKEDLFRINSLNFEALSGDKAGLFSVRVNLRYRIEFTLEDTADQPVMTICNIIELSNHYK